MYNILNRFVFLSNLSKLFFLFFLSLFPCFLTIDIILRAILTSLYFLLVFLYLWQWGTFVPSMLLCVNVSTMLVPLQKWRDSAHYLVYPLWIYVPARFWQSIIFVCPAGVCHHTLALSFADLCLRFLFRFLLNFQFGAFFRCWCRSKRVDFLRSLLERCAIPVSKNDLVCVYGAYQDSWLFAALFMNSSNTPIWDFCSCRSLNSAVGAWRKRWWCWSDPVAPVWFLLSLVPTMLSCNALEEWPAWRCWSDLFWRCMILWCPNFRVRPSWSIFPSHSSHLASFPTGLIEEKNGYSSIVNELQV